MNLMVTTNQKHIINIYTKKRKEPKHNIKKVIKPQGKRLTEEERKREELHKQPEN